MAASPQLAACPDVAAPPRTTASPDSALPGDLTYCTNVHPGEPWDEVFANLHRYLPQVKARVAPGHAFGIGLRLSAVAAAQLRAPGQVEALQDFLAREGLHVSTLNGFPFGQFHGARVKERAYLPDWRDGERAGYTDDLAAVLATLLPDGGAGCISTVPGAFRARAADAAAVDAIADQLIQQAVRLDAQRSATGRSICLALEPEPCCLLETVAETVQFFNTHLFGRQAIARATALSGGSSAQAEQLLRRHLGVCFDVCHAAVEFEDEDALEVLHAAGIAVPKLQLSAALRLPRVDAATAEALLAFDDGVYLHQVVEQRDDGSLRRFADLPDALAALAAEGADAAREWRVHFHVPLFRREAGAFETTQDYLRAVLARHRRSGRDALLEVETYTWGVLPEAQRAPDLADAIAQEIEWVLCELTA